MGHRTQEGGGHRPRERCRESGYSNRRWRKMMGNPGEMSKGHLLLVKLGVGGKSNKEMGRGCKRA